MNHAEAPSDLSEPTAMPIASDPYAVLRNRDFLLYLIGRLVATFGQQMFATAVLWELYDRTGTGLALGLVGLTQIVPMFAFTLPAGHLADNHNRKSIIVLMTAVVAAGSLCLTLISGLRAPVPWIYLCLFVLATARTFLWAASASFLPHLVDRKDLARAINWSSTTFQIAAIAGPAAAGGIIALAHHRAAPVYAINALAAATCCVLFSAVRRHHVVAVKEEMTLRTLLTGFRFVFASRIILGIITLDMFAVLLGGCTALLPIYAKNILRVGPSGLGVLAAALPLGSLLCAFVLAHRPPLQKAGRALLWAVTAFGFATLGFGLSTRYWVSFLALFACGAVDNVSVVVRHTLVQLLTPDEKRGRVSAVNNLFIGTSNELGGFESGFTAQLLGPILHRVSATSPLYAQAMATGAIWSTIVGGVGTILVVLAVALVWPEIRKYGRLDGS